MNNLRLFVEKFKNNYIVYQFLTLLKTFHFYLNLMNDDLTPDDKFLQNSKFEFPIGFFFSRLYYFC